MTDSFRILAYGLIMSVTIVSFPSSETLSAEDSVEFLNGSTLRGTITSIRKADKEFDFDTSVGGKTFSRVYPFAKVHAVNYQGKRYELTPKSAPPRSASSTDKSELKSGPSKSEVAAVINAAGAIPPDWFSSTPLSYPKTLDLSWPLKPPTKGWQSQKNMGQYIWSVINENPSKWHSGIRLVHHILSLHQDEPELLQRDMQALGSLYFRLMQDYPRAAFWYEKGKARADQPAGIHLAECYWRLGNRKMALDVLRARTIHMGAIKLYGDMGEIDRALVLAKVYGVTQVDYQSNILAADALRQAGRLDAALTYYEKVLNSKNFRNEEYEKRFKARARESIQTIRLYDQADVSKVADGTYRDDSTGYNGKLSVEVQVAAGKIGSIKVTNHREKQFYSALTDTPKQLVALQSVQGVDATSGATITSQAIVNASAKALAQGTTDSGKAGIR